MPNCEIIVCCMFLGQYIYFLLLQVVLLLLWETIFWKYGLALYSYLYLCQFCMVLLHYFDLMDLLILLLILTAYY